MSPRRRGRPLLGGTGTHLRMTVRMTAQEQGWLHALADQLGEVSRAEVLRFCLRAVALRIDHHAGRTA